MFLPQVIWGFQYFHWPFVLWQLKNGPQNANFMNLVSQHVFGITLLALNRLIISIHLTHNEKGSTFYGVCCACVLQGYAKVLVSTNYNSNIYSHPPMSCAFSSTAATMPLLPLLQPPPPQAFAADAAVIADAAAIIAATAVTAAAAANCCRCCQC